MRGSSKSKSSVLERFKKARLYAVTMDGGEGVSVPQSVELACRGGIDVLQLRAKNLSSKELLSLAKHCKEICARFNVLFIVNDRVDIALASSADGVHLGQDDFPVQEAQKMAAACLGEKWFNRFLIGCSTHSLTQAKKAEQEGAQYLGCGPIFSTPTKPDYSAVGLALVREYARNIKTPFVAIGGIDEKNVSRVLDAGARRVAVVRAIFSKQDIEGAARSFKKILK